MGHGLKAEGKEELSEEGRGGGLSLLEGQGRRSMVPWRNSHSEAEVEGGWKWEARKDFHGRRTAALRSGETTKVSGLGRVSGQGQAGKHSPASHCSSRAGTSHRSAPGTRRLAVGRRGVRPGCWVQRLPSSAPPPSPPQRLPPLQCPPPASLCISSSFAVETLRATMKASFLTEFPLRPPSPCTAVFEGQGVRASACDVGGIVQPQL